MEGPYGVTSLGHRSGQLERGPDGGMFQKEPAVQQVSVLPPAGADVQAGRQLAEPLTLARAGEGLKARASGSSDWSALRARRPQALPQSPDPEPGPIQSSRHPLDRKGPGPAAPSGTHHPSHRHRNTCCHCIPVPRRGPREGTTCFLPGSAWGSVHSQSSSGGSLDGGGGQWGVGAVKAGVLGQDPHSESGRCTALPSVHPPPAPPLPHCCCSGHDPSLPHPLPRRPLGPLAAILPPS